jgi:hypothetical protein
MNLSGLRIQKIGDQTMPETLPETLPGPGGVAIGDVIVGTMMAVLGLVGLLMASRALDSEIYIFGLSLALFAAVFDFGLIRAHFDKKGAQP